MNSRCITIKIIKERTIIDKPMEKIEQSTKNAQ